MAEQILHTKLGNATPHGQTVSVSSIATMSDEDTCQTLEPTVTMVTEESVVTDFPAVEVEVQDKAVQDIGLQQLTAVQSDDEDDQIENAVQQVQGEVHVTVVTETYSPDSPALTGNEDQRQLTDDQVMQTENDDHYVHSQTAQNEIPASKQTEPDSAKNNENSTIHLESDMGAHVIVKQEPEQLQGYVQEVSMATTSSAEEQLQQRETITFMVVTQPPEVSDSDIPVMSKEELLHHVELKTRKGNEPKKAKRYSHDSVEVLMPPGNMLWCQDCGKSNHGACKKHGPLIQVPDTEVPSHARLTLPSVLNIKKIKGDSQAVECLGVFAKRNIKARTQFGPLQAPFCIGKNNTGFLLKGYDCDGTMKGYDLSDEDQCNWMMFVQPAQTYDEQNIAAYLYQGNIYFTTIKAVDSGQELKVWYAADYAVKIGMSLFTDSEISKEDQEEEIMETEDAEDAVLDAGEVEDSDEEFQVADMMGMDNDSDSDGSFSGTYCISCDTQFGTKYQLFRHACKSKRPSPKKKFCPGESRRKSRPRKIENAETSSIKGTKSKRGRRKAGRKQRETGTRALRNKKQKNKGEVEKNRKKYARTPRFTCSFCEAQFTAEDPYRIHEASHTGKSAYICDHPGCGKGFDTKFTFWRHQLTHNQPLHRKCPYCDKAFNRMDHLKTHLKTHDFHRATYLCDKCGKSYLYKNTYDYHMALHEAKEGVSLTCIICSETFESKETLLEHTLTHNRYKSVADLPKKHHCPLCNKTFGTNKDVTRHMVVHTKDKCFLCELCPQRFGRKDHLSRHYKTNHSKEAVQHQKEREGAASNTFQCDTCFQHFKKEKLLATHIRTVHKVKETKKVAALLVGGTKSEGKNSVQTTSSLPQSDSTISDATVSSSSLNLYAISNPQVPNQPSVQPVNIKPVALGYVPVSTSNTKGVPLTTPHPIINTAQPVSNQTFINGQNSLVPMTVSMNISEQMKDRTVYTSGQPVVVRRQQPWSFSGPGDCVVEDRADHSYSTAQVATTQWTPKVPNYRPGASAAEVEAARLLQNNPAGHGNFPNHSRATAMAVAWDAITEFVAVQPGSNTSNSHVGVVASILQQPPQNAQIPNPNQMVPQHHIQPSTHPQ